ncbi:MAG: hypothetical protein K6G12_11460 [Lachnospiraceae bacterium]|nr:hypothetical protein [Lachnospiraceae bacterium]
MGSGLQYRCSKCKKEYYVSWGTGFLFPQAYRKTIHDIKTGKYGAEWKDMICENKNSAINAEDYVYVCGKCGAWKTEPDLSIYVPKDTSKPANELSGKGSKDNSGRRDYVTEWDLRESYRILKRRVHKCDNCGGVVHRALESELKALKCPYCGGEPEEGFGGDVLWD